MKNITYDYYVHNINSDNETGYKAVIPAFGNAIVFGEDLRELEAGIVTMISSEIKDLKKAKKPIPKPEKDITASGKILLRIDPALHEKLTIEAKANKKSLNSYISERLTA